MSFNNAYDRKRYKQEANRASEDFGDGSLLMRPEDTSIQGASEDFMDYLQNPASDMENGAENDAIMKDAAPDRADFDALKGNGTPDLSQIAPVVAPQNIGTLAKGSMSGSFRGGSTSSDGVPQEDILSQLKAAREANEASMLAAKRADESTNFGNTLSKSGAKFAEAMANITGTTNIKLTPSPDEAKEVEFAGNANKGKLEALMQNYGITKGIADTKYSQGRDVISDKFKNMSLAMQQKQIDASSRKEQRAEDYLTDKKTKEERSARTQQFNTISKALSSDPRFKPVMEQSMAFDKVGDSIQGARSGNQAAIAALGTQLARAMGEVGVLTDTDVTRYVAGTSWGRQLKTWAEKGAIGELPESALKDMTSNIDKIQAKLEKNKKDIYERAASRVKATYKGLPEEDIYGMLGYTPASDTPQQNAIVASPQDEAAKKWALDNPKDARSTAILKRLGL